MNNIRQITVIGSGTMGNGITQLFATYGFFVTIFDTSALQLEKALEIIKNNLERMQKKELISSLIKEEALKNIVFTTTLHDALSNADLVIEAITENFEVKKNLFEQLDQLCKPTCILASNTSSISITKIAACTQRPHLVIGMHFMNPVPIMPLVEIIVGLRTHTNTKLAVEQLTIKLQKTPIVVKDYPGFVANRILMPMINEAIHTLNDGVADVLAIDQIMKLGMAHPMGPLELADFIGLDVCLYILNVLHSGLGEAKYAPCPLLVTMVDAKLLGVKTKHGFYEYVEGSKEKKVSELFSKLK